MSASNRGQDNPCVIKRPADDMQEIIPDSLALIGGPSRSLRWRNLNKCLVQDLIPGTRFEMKLESQSTAIGFVDMLCEKGKTFFR